MTRIFKRRTGFATLDAALARLHANTAELLMVLDRPDIPLHDLRFGKRHPLPGDPTQDQRRHPLGRRGVTAVTPSYR